MGSEFDYFYWKEPGTTAEVQEYQTRDLACRMHKYRVTDTGQLEVNRFDHEGSWRAWTEPGYVPDPKKSDWVEQWEPVDHSGAVYFYDREGTGQTAVFVRGRLHWWGAEGAAQVLERTLRELLDELPDPSRGEVRFALGLLGREA